MERKTKYGILIVTGIVILITFAGFSWYFNKSLESAEPGSEEEQTYVKYYFFSKVIASLGFLIAIIPSTLQLKHKVEKLKEENN